jgi:hypothetical protein
MKAKLLPLIMLIGATSLVAQKRPEWQRVYTFDESTIEMNTREVTSTGNGVGRVKFRWSFREPEVYKRDRRVKYTIRLEVIEFDCKAEGFRTYDVTFLDAAGKTVSYEGMYWLGEWNAFGSSDMMERLARPACRLINPIPVSRSAAASSELKKVTEFALTFNAALERSKDFRPIIARFFVGDYLKRYVHDKGTNWFLNVDSNTAIQARPAELQRYYTALMNTGYLSSLYVASRYRPDTEDIATENLVPVEIAQLIRRHPYAARYGNKLPNFDYLTQQIDSVKRLRSYTDLLESLAPLFLRYVKGMSVESSTAYRAMLNEGAFIPFDPHEFICSRECLGFPKGTRLFEVDVPLFHLQLIELKGKLKVVSMSHHLS